jgi:hypothetical protein
MRYQDHVLRHRPTGYWPLQGRRTVRDLAGRSSATWTNLPAAADDRPGIAGLAGPGLATRFDRAAGTYATASHHADWNSTHVTIMAWVRSATIGASINTIASRDDEAANRQFQFRLTATTALPQWIPFLGGGPVVVQGTTPINSPAPDGNPYHHIVGTYDGTEATIVVNGVVEASSASALAFPAVTAAMDIGRKSAGSTNLIDGHIAHLAIFPRYLGLAAIRRLYVAGRRGVAAPRDRDRARLAA